MLRHGWIVQQYGGHIVRVEAYSGLIISGGGWLPAEPREMILFVIFF